MNETVRDLGYVGISLLKGQVCFRADDPILDAIIYNTCPTCGGTGGCPKCNGTSMGMDLEGAYIDGLCPRCEGTGLCPDCKDHTHIISAELREEAIGAAAETERNADRVGPLTYGAIVDAVLSTVFGHVEVAREIITALVPADLLNVRVPIIDVPTVATQVVTQGGKARRYTIAILDKEA